MTQLTKTAQVLKYMEAGDYRQALKIARTFRIGVPREDQKLLARAYESYGNGYFYAQMKFDPEECKRQGIELLHRMYGDLLPQFCNQFQKSG